MKEKERMFRITNKMHLVLQSIDRLVGSNFVDPKDSVLNNLDYLESAVKELREITERA